MPLTAEQEAKIGASVAAAERRTAAEFAVVVARTSDDYAGFPLVWAGAVALVLGGVAALLRPDLGVFDLCLLQGAVYVLSAVGFSMLPTRARLAPPFVRRERAEAQAALQFAARVVQRTKDGLGLMLYVSLAEHVAIIHVDKRIAAALPASTWQDIVTNLVERAGDGRVSEGIIAAIDACAATLAPHFPPQPGQVNEIADHVTAL